MTDYWVHLLPVLCIIALLLPLPEDYDCIPNPYYCKVKEATGVSPIAADFGNYQRCYEACVSQNLEYANYELPGWFRNEECWCEGGNRLW